MRFRYICRKRWVKVITNAEKSGRRWRLGEAGEEDEEDESSRQSIMDGGYCLVIKWLLVKLAGWCYYGWLLSEWVSWFCGWWRICGGWEIGKSIRLPPSRRQLVLACSRLERRSGVIKRQGSSWRKCWWWWWWGRPTTNQTPVVGHNQQQQTNEEEEE
jgi:hypothetical protein